MKIKYIEFEGERYDEDEIYDLVEKYYDEDMCADWVDDCYEETKIGCLTFSPSRIVKELDPIAWGCMIGDIQDLIGGDITYDFKQSSNGDVIRTSFGELTVVEKDVEENEVVD